MSKAQRLKAGEIPGGKNKEVMKMLKSINPARLTNGIMMIFCRADRDMFGGIPTGKQQRI